ncbi:c-type cytochrome biogenesis protein CcmI [Azohydromonas sp.]|uniref:c-type cytochrome biogenesis protein CcmI n=1 Tax=Azohydromonas sp. TaxID=1872666 RepID=UPI002CD456F4|nr:c-type cytochrome biogenesis protein CcmI [Azohydromonas sp.]HMM86596.1 c-type cytochrome biogenesis protein CcmI [Azohydromonas sp.]
MTLFWIAAATLVVASLAALARPLLRGAHPHAGDATQASNVRILREQLAELDAELAAGALAADQHAAARAEIERRVLEETRDAEVALAARPGRGAALTLAVVLPLAAVLLYLALGNRTALDPVLARAPSQATPQDVEVLVERLAQRMREQPGDADGWVLLGRSYAAMGRFEPARDAYAQAVALSPDDASLLADYADALAMTQERGLLGEPERLVQRALRADPDHVKALALAGTAALQRGDAAAAVRHWERAKSLAPPDSPFASGLEEGLRQARAAAAPASQAGAAESMGGGAGRAPGTASAAAEAAGREAGAGLRVRVALAGDLAGRARPQDTVFVFARPVEGPRMPLAVARLRVADLPAELTLDDSSAMSPQMRLSAFERVVVVARVSRSGDVEPQPGDLEGQSGAVASRGAVALAIDRERE